MIKRRRIVLIVSISQLAAGVNVDALKMGTRSLMIFFAMIIKTDGVNNARDILNTGVNVGSYYYCTIDESQAIAAEMSACEHWEED